MAKTDLNIPTLSGKFSDLRDTIPGDSYNFSWVRPLSQVNFLAIHHTGAPDTQTPTEIANFHINNNGWGGIGYHFLIGKDGVVYYVGDIGTARANVANLNEQVIGICLIGNFTLVEPTSQQLDSAQKLCDFFINSYPDLSNVTSWDAVAGHKELPGQSTACPGDTWSSWKEKIFVIKENKDSEVLKSQIDSLQTTLASVNQQVISLQEALQERDEEINNLKNRLATATLNQPAPVATPSAKVDNTLTIVGALILFYKFIFPPRKEALA